MDYSINLKFLSFSRTITIPRQWIQFGIVAAVILASSVLSFWGSRNIFVLIIGSLLGCAGILALLREPNLGFIFIFLSAMFARVSGPSGLSIAMLVVALMLGLWVLDMLVLKRSFVLIRSHIMLPVAAFLVVASIALGMGQVPWFVFAQQAPLDSQLGGFSIIVFSIGALLLAAHLIKDIRWLEIIVWVFIGLGTFYIIGRALRLGMIERIYDRGFTAGSMYWTWLTALAASQLIFNQSLDRRLRGVLVGILLLTMYVAVGQAYDWKSGWLPPLVVLAVLFGIRYRKLALFAIPFLAIASAAIVANLIASDDYSWGTRVDAWMIVLEISRISPVFGMGFSNYYWYTPLFPIRGWQVSFNSHSQFVDLIAQTGYLGLLCFVWLFFEFGRLSWGVGNKLPGGFARAYSFGVFAGIVGTMVAAFLVDWVLPFVYNIGLKGFRASVLPWIFMGGMVALQQMTLRESNS